MVHDIVNNPAMSNLKYALDSSNGKLKTGRTTKLMINAPLNSFYIIDNPSNISYYIRLSAFILRSDLKIISKQSIRYGMFRGYNCYIVVDHYCELNAEQFNEINIANSRYKNAS